MELTLQELIDAAQGVGADATKEQRAEAVAALLNERGADAEKYSNEALEDFKKIREGGDTSPETLAALALLADVVDGAKLRQVQIDTEAQAKQDELAELEARVNMPGTEGGEGGEDGGGSEGEDPGTGTGTGTGDGDGDDTGTGETTPPPPVEDTDAPAAADTVGVTAGAKSSVVRRVNLSAIKRVSPPVEQKNNNGVVITAAADVNGFTMGQRLDMNGLTRAVIARMSKFPKQRIPNGYMAAGIASFKLPFDQKLIADKAKNDQDVLDYAGDQSRLKGGSLVAAGGWCSPSETLYDLCPGLESPTAGLIDVPDIQVTRGGIRTTEGPDIAGVYSSIGFAQTEAQAIAGDTKPCYRVPCPSFTETRLDLSGVCIISGILNDDAYPEMTRRIVELALAVHAHKYNADTIARMVALATAVGPISAGPSAATSLLNGLEMQIVDYRYRYRAPENLLLEVILPIWIKPVLRADLSLRTGQNYADNAVTDQQLDGFFTARGASVQYVYDWQDAFTVSPATPPLFGNAAAITEWPNSVQALIYAAGSFVRGRGEIINMEGIYDAQDLKVNDFTRLFMEEKILVRRRCYQARLVTFPLAVNGATGCCVALDANGNIAA